MFRSPPEGGPQESGPTSSGLPELAAERPPGISGTASAGAPSAGSRVAGPVFIAPVVPPAPPHRRAPGDPRSANLGLLSLFLSLLGFLVIAGVLYEFKFHHVTEYLGGAPTRVVFVIGILLAASPFLLTVFRRVPVLFLVPPIVLVFFLYPIFSPYGIPYSRDPVFLYQFAHTLLTTGAWIPGAGVTEQAVSYSYYPGAAVFSAEAASLTSTTLFSSFPWSTELLRLLVIPPTIFALTKRLFGSKAAPLAVLLYAVLPSIEMNIPTQQDFAVTFFLLALTALAFLTVNPPSESLFLRVSVVMATSVVIVSHYTSTYLMLGVLAALALLPRVLWRQSPYPAARSLPVFVRALAFGVLWGGLVALPALTLQWSVLSSNLAALIHPTQAVSAIPGASFPSYEIAWVGLAILGMSVIAILTLLEAKQKDDRSFVTVALITTLLLGILSIPFLSTGFNFLALREFEYTGVFLAPVTAWWVTRRLAVDHPRPIRTPRAPPRLDQLTRGAATRLLQSPKQIAGHPAFALVLVALFITGGSLVPLSTRDQFASSKEDQVDSPMFINHDAYAAAEWTASHMSRSHRVWGDYLAYTVFGGFGGIRIEWDSYLVFNGAGFSPQAVAVMNLGSYVVVDPYLTTFYTNPMFFGPANDQPSGPLSPAEVAKFQNPAYFSVVFENPLFTIYEITAIPPAG